MGIEEQIAETKSQLEDANTEGKGFQFPAAIEVTAVGVAEGEFDLHVLALLERGPARPRVDTLRIRASRGGKYQSVSVVLDCDTRADYDNAHASLRASPSIKWTL